MPWSMSTERRRPCRLAIAAAVLSAAAATACTVPTRDTVVVVETITEVVDAPAPAPLLVPAPIATPVQGQNTGLEGFNDFARQLPAQVGLAVVPVGGGQAFTAGTLTTDVAWSTIKVPLAIAALGADPTQIGNATAALTTSDNQAAQSMWDALGSGTPAAAQVQQVLARFGDPATMVQPHVTRAGYTAFGQTEWPITAQAQFTAMLPCSPEAATVLSLMGQVSHDQSWGLGALPGAHFKGGWGPDESGGYLVRQLGIADSGNGQVAIAIAAAPTSGTFNDGISVVNQIANWLSTRLPTLPVNSTC